MKHYDYYENEKNDVIGAIREMLCNGLNTQDYMDRYDLADFLNDVLWCDDSVTGNGSGSYTFNRSLAAEYVQGNDHLVRHMVEEFCIDANTLVDHFMSEDWEWFDVSIRCFILGTAIDDALAELEESDEVKYMEA